MKDIKNTSNSLTIWLIILSGILFSLNGFSQTPNSNNNDKQNANVNVSIPINDSIRNADKVVIAQDEKSFVTGDDGQKVFFLSTPNKKVEQTEIDTKPEAKPKND